MHHVCTTGSTGDRFRAARTSVSRFDILTPCQYFSGSDVCIDQDIPDLAAEEADALAPASAGRSAPDRSRTAPPGSCGSALSATSASRSSWPALPSAVRRSTSTSADLHELIESLLLDVEVVLQQTANPWISGEGEPIAALREVARGSRAGLRRTRPDPPRGLRGRAPRQTARAGLDGVLRALGRCSCDGRSPMAILTDRSRQLVVGNRPALERGARLVHQRSGRSFGGGRTRFTVAL